MNHPSPRILLPKTLRWMRQLEFPHKLGIMDRLFKHTLRGQPIGWVETHPGWVWKLDPENTTHRWMIYGDYQGPSLWRWLRGKRNGINRIVDSGANIGQTIAYFTRICPQAHIHAYEPGENAREWLESCLSANDIRQVDVSSKGLSNKNGRARLHPEGPSESHGSWNSITPDSSGEIMLSTLDEEFKEKKWDMVDFWKIDVEGFEWEVLQGAESALESGRVRVLYVETGASQAINVFPYLRDKGFHAWFESGESFLPLDLSHPQEGNFLFIHRNSLLLRP